MLNRKQIKLLTEFLEYGAKESLRLEDYDYVKLHQETLKKIGKDYSFLGQIKNALEVYEEESYEDITIKSYTVKIYDGWLCLDIVVYSIGCDICMTDMIRIGKVYEW
ncbi:MAG: hypothetical protein KFW09_04955 [Oscillospiraceae bacterium]|nr:hypothetical protein [Oscillospiraceae bacterium]